MRLLSLALIASLIGLVGVSSMASAGTCDGLVDTNCDCPSPSLGVTCAGGQSCGVYVAVVYCVVGAGLRNLNA
jgi:hypothetical protein